MIRREIEQFLRETGMPETRLGRDAAGDPRLVGDMRNGRQFGPALADRIRVFMARHRASAAQ